VSEAGEQPRPYANRFPGFDVLAQVKHWDRVTAGVVLDRLAVPATVRFFTPREQAAAIALCDQLLDQRGDPRIPVVSMIDARLAGAETDGWHYQDMPEDADAWRASLRVLDRDATERFGGEFATCSWEHQATLVQAVQDRGSGHWHELNAAHVWSLWTRYACTAFFSHPSVWDEIGFPGPAYPRGYKNPGVDSREPFEVADARPNDDPARSSQ
jgi:hypothetical protein